MQKGFNCNNYFSPSSFLEGNNAFNFTDSCRIGYIKNGIINIIIEIIMPGIKKTF